MHGKNSSTNTSRARGCSAKSNCASRSNRGLALRLHTAKPAVANLAATALKCRFFPSLLFAFAPHTQISTERTQNEFRIGPERLPTHHWPRAVLVHHRGRCWVADSRFLAMARTQTTQGSHPLLHVSDTRISQDKPAGIKIKTMGAYVAGLGTDLYIATGSTSHGANLTIEVAHSFLAAPWFRLGFCFFRS